MKIAVVNNMTPFVRGGAEELGEHLVRQLELHGHQVELYRIPFRYEPAFSIYTEMLACSMIHVGDADLVIGLKFPAYLVNHSNKVIWLVHQYRQAYDMWDSGYSNIPSNREGEQLRNAIRSADQECFYSVERIFTISPVTQNRLKHYNDVDSQLLRTPLNGPEDFVVGNYGDYVFCGGRINSTKRQYLLIEAMQFVRSNAKLLIAGPADSIQEELRIRRLREKLGLEKRVRLEISYHPRDVIANWVNNSLACAYLPIDEDSYSYVVMEGNQAGKAVVTTTDSGGLLDLVVDGETGWVREPDPRQIAEAIDLAFSRRQRTIDMGIRSRNRWLDKDLNWESTIKRLVG